MNFLADIADFITDEDFLAGVATGVSETIDKGEARRDKTLDRLQTYGLEKSNRLEQEYINDLDANEAQVKALAANLADDEFSANSQAVLAAAQYLIQTKTLPGAIAEAKRLYEQQKKYGISQVKEVGANAANEGVSLSFRNIATGFTRKPAPVNLSGSGIETRPTFLDRVFGGPTVEEEAQTSIENLTSGVPDLDPLPIIASTGYNADMIIRPDMPIKDEIVRFKLLAKAAQDAGNNEDLQEIKAKIEVLKLGEIRQGIAEAAKKGPFTVSESIRTTNAFVLQVTKVYNLTLKQEILGSGLDPLMSFEEASDAATEADMVTKKMSRDLSDVRLSGNANFTGELHKLQQAIFYNLDYTITEDIYGRKSIQLAEEGGPKLFKKLTVAVNDADADDDTDTDDTDDDANASAYSGSGNTSSQTVTTIILDTPQILAAVDAFKNLPDVATAPDKNKARINLQRAIMAANTGMNARVAMDKARELLN
tara:strand:+ start:2897 stop:4339 length:1443 start_codon:yes stop_codon:yes gene_type:complete